MFLTAGCDLQRGGASGLQRAEEGVLPLLVRRRLAESGRIRLDRGRYQEAILHLHACASPRQLHRSEKAG